VDGFDPGDNTNQEPPRKITVNDSLKNHSRANCIYERVKKMIESGSSNPYNNLFWRLTLPFSGPNDLRLDIKLVEEDEIGTGRDGATYPDKISEGYITIKINRKSVEYTSELNTANTILHELMHAYYFAIIHKMGGVSALLAYQGDQEPYKSLKIYYAQFGWMRAQHNVMANKTYRDFMIKGLKAFMGANQLTDWRYQAMSWAGLQMTNAWNNLEAPKQKQVEAALKVSVKKDASNKDQCE
jgi:hypothetical protein